MWFKAIVFFAYFSLDWQFTMGSGGQFWSHPESLLWLYSSDGSSGSSWSKWPHSYVFQFSSVQSLSRVWLFATPWTAACQASLSITNSRSSLRLTSIEWCHPAISSSVVPFSSCPQFLPASESFPMSQLFAWGGQSTRVSALASVLPTKKCQKPCLSHKLLSSV